MMNDFLFIVKLELLAKATHDPNVTLYFSHKSYVTGELWDDDIEGESFPVYGILESIDGFVVKMGEVLPQNVSGNITLNTTRGSLGAYLRIHDYLDKYSFLNSKVSIYSFFKNENQIGDYVNFKLVNTTKVTSYNLASQENVFILNCDYDFFASVGLLSEVTEVTNSNLDTIITGSPIVIGDREYPVILPVVSTTIEADQFWTDVDNKYSFYGVDSGEDYFEFFRTINNFYYVYVKNKQNNFIRKKIDTNLVIDIQSTGFTANTYPKVVTTGNIDFSIPLVLTEAQSEKIIDGFRLQVTDRESSGLGVAGDVEFEITKRIIKPDAVTIEDGFWSPMEASFESLTDKAILRKTKAVYSGVTANNILHCLFNKPLIDYAPYHITSDYIVTNTSIVIKENREQTGVRAYTQFIFHVFEKTAFPTPIEANFLLFKNQTQTENIWSIVFDESITKQMLGPNGGNNRVRYYSFVYSPWDNLRQHIKIGCFYEYTTSLGSNFYNDGLLYPHEKLPDMHIAFTGIMDTTTGGGKITGTTQKVIKKTHEVIRLILFKQFDKDVAKLNTFYNNTRFSEAEDLAPELSGVFLEQQDTREALSQILHETCSMLIPNKEGNVDFWTYGITQESVTTISEADCVITSITGTDIEEIINSINLKYDLQFKYLEPNAGSYNLSKIVKKKKNRSIQLYGEKELALQEASLNFIYKRQDADRFIDYIFAKNSLERWIYTIEVPYWKFNYKDIQLWDILRISHVNNPTDKGTASEGDVFNLNDGDGSSDWFEGFFKRHAKHYTFRVIAITPKVDISNNSHTLQLELRVLNNRDEIF